MTNSSSRREFLGGMAASLAGIGAPFARARTGNSSDLLIIDTHLHLWDLSKFRLRWLEAEAYRDLARDFLLDDFRAATRQLSIPWAIYMEVDVEPAQQVAEAEFIIELCRQPGSPLAGAVISGRPAADEFREYITRFQAEPEIKGVREVLTEARTPRGYCLDPAFQHGLRLLGEVGLLFDLCLRPDELEDGAKLVAACPDTRFVLDHCGNPDLRSKDQTIWRKGLAAVAEQPNVVCKVSGFIATAPIKDWAPDDIAPVVDHAFEVFGPDRLMFASDWPVCTLTATYQRWVDALKTVVLDRGELATRKLFQDNAARTYGLVEPGVS